MEEKEVRKRLQAMGYGLRWIEDKWAVIHIGRNAVYYWGNTLEDVVEWMIGQDED